MIAGKRIGTLQEAFALLNCHRLPARLNTSEVAVLLGFQEHDVAPLVAARLLTPLGKPAPNAPKYFAAVEVLACSENRDWLSSATRAFKVLGSKKSPPKDSRYQGRRLQWLICKEIVVGCQRQRSSILFPSSC